MIVCRLRIASKIGMAEKFKGGALSAHLEKFGMPPTRSKRDRWPTDANPNVAAQVVADTTANMLAIRN
jgi:hypothetical protein